MSQPRPRGYLAGAALFLLAVGGAAAAAAALSGGGKPACWGAAGGLLLGCAEHAFGVLALARARDSRPGAARGLDLWGLGMLGRLALVSVLTLAFWRAWPESFTSAMLPMAGVYLAAHFWEIVRMWRRSGQQPGRATGDERG